MAGIMETAANLLEYAGVRSKNYYHSSTAPSYDPDDPLTYYLDQTLRAGFAGPRDPQGIPLYQYQGKADYLPVLIGFYGLGRLQRYRVGKAEADLADFLAVADWLISTQTSDGTWRSNFPMPRFKLAAGYPSAMVQGVAISCLTRAHRLNRRADYLEAAVKALKPFHVDVGDGGVTSHEGGRAFYEEYPTEPCHHVLNGFLYALWGLLDMARFTDHARAQKLYDEGLETFVDWLPKFDIGYWSLYHISEGPRNPATIHYQRLHVDQLEVMHALTGMEIFAQYRSRWQGFLNGRLNALRTLPPKIRWRLFGN